VPCRPLTGPVLSAGGGLTWSRLSFAKWSNSTESTRPVGRPRMHASRPGNSTKTRSHRARSVRPLSSDLSPPRANSRARVATLASGVPEQGSRATKLHRRQSMLAERSAIQGRWATKLASRFPSLASSGRTKGTLVAKHPCHFPPLASWALTKGPRAANLAGESL
jgi:hypothetical protein